jgi:hypothetical protein
VTRRGVSTEIAPIPGGGTRDEGRKAQAFGCAARRDFGDTKQGKLE